MSLLCSFLSFFLSFSYPQDRDHKDAAIAFANLGYHLLVEKPMATTAEDCQAIHDACAANGVRLCVCHVLRYAPHNRKIKELIDSGAIGDVMSIQASGTPASPALFLHDFFSFAKELGS